MVLVCKRCGKCCQDYQPDFTDVRLPADVVDFLQKAVRYIQTGKGSRCIMLGNEQVELNWGGKALRDTLEQKATCILHAVYGPDAKPVICREHFCLELLDKPQKFPQPFKRIYGA